MATEQAQPIALAVLAEGHLERGQVEGPVGVGQLERGHLLDQGVADEHPQDQVVRAARHGADPASADAEGLGQAVGRRRPSISGLPGQHAHVHHVHVTGDAHADERGQVVRPLVLDREPAGEHRDRPAPAIDPGPPPEPVDRGSHASGEGVRPPGPPDHQGGTAREREDPDDDPNRGHPHHHDDQDREAREDPVPHQVAHSGGDPTHQPHADERRHRHLRRVQAKR